MSGSSIIVCFVCDKPCGKYHHDTGPSYYSGGEQGYIEGPCENFVFRDQFHCSQECMDKHKADWAENIEDD